MKSERNTKRNATMNTKTNPKRNTKRYANMATQIKTKTSAKTTYFPGIFCLPRLKHDLKNDLLTKVEIDMQPRPLGP